MRGNGRQPVSCFLKGKMIEKSRRAKEPANDRMLAQVSDLAEPLCREEGMELVHVEYQREAGGRILRVYIDKPGGVGLNDCVNVSRQLSDLLDVYVERDDAYRLEISSPGPDRPLGKTADYERFKGRDIRIKTARPLDGQKKVLTSYLEMLNEQKSKDEDIGLTEKELDMQIIITQGLLDQLENISKKDSP